MDLIAPRKIFYTRKESFNRDTWTGGGGRTVFLEALTLRSTFPRDTCPTLRTWGRAVGFTSEGRSAAVRRDIISSLLFPPLSVSTCRTSLYCCTCVDSYSCTRGSSTRAYSGTSTTSRRPLLTGPTSPTRS